MVTVEERKLIYDHYVQDPLWDFRQGEGISARLAPLLHDDPLRINLLNSLLLTLIGTPIIFYGDEIGKGNDLAYHELKVRETGYSDSRNLARGPLDWSQIATHLANPTTLASQVFFPLREMIAERRNHPSLSRGELTFLDVEDHRVIAFWRTSDGDRVTVLANLSGDEVAFTLGGEAVTLAPFEYRWL
jgi:maltose alpha-D-glucosyltransferase/alpha-amylase